MTRIRLRKKILFYGITSLLAFVFVEALSFVAFLVVEGPSLSLSNIYAERTRRAHAADTLDAATTVGIPAFQIRPGPRPVEVLHPYLGFVYDYEKDDDVSRYGFGNTTDLFHRTSDDTVVIGIVGGSVAGMFSWTPAALINELEKSDSFANKEIVIVRMALGGYKQPQQFMTLSYMLTLGAHVDLLINLDGFNEVAIPPVENIPKAVHPFFPRNWSMRVHRGVPDRVTQSMVGEIIYLGSKRRQWAEAFLKSPFRYSITMALVWYSYDQKLATAISHAQTSLQQYKAEGNPYVATGPPYHYEHEENLFQDLAAVWKRGSVQMHKLCSANGIQYFHFLQPNQYVPGSKSMGEEELKQAFVQGHKYQKGVEKGYPYLIKAGKELVQEGVRFFDLTMLFSERAEPIYADACCHLNEAGYDILGSAIGKAIVEQIKTETNGAEH